MLFNGGKRWKEAHPIGSAVVQLVGGGLIIAISIADHATLPVYIVGGAMALVGIVRLVKLTQ